MKLAFNDEILGINIEKYANNDNLAIMLICETEGFPEPYATITVNIDDLDENQSCVDTNNCPWAIDLIEEYKLGEPTGKIIQSGFCTYPVYQFDINELKKYEITP